MISLPWFWNIIKISATHSHISYYRCSGEVLSLLLLNSYLYSFFLLGEVSPYRLKFVQMAQTQEATMVKLAKKDKLNNLQLFRQTHCWTWLRVFNSVDLSGLQCMVIRIQIFYFHNVSPLYEIGGIVLSNYLNLFSGEVVYMEWIVL